MKLNKYLIFKIDAQKFAVRIHRVLNVIEMARIVDKPIMKPYQKAFISFRGADLPLIDLRDILGMPPSLKPLNECILVLELKINGKLEIAGLSIDEIIEISEIDELRAFPFNSIYNSQTCDFREGIVIKQDEPLVLINTDKIMNSVNIEYTKAENIRSVSVN